MAGLNDTDVNSNDESRATWFVHDRNGRRWDIRIRKPRNADEHRRAEAPDTKGAA